MNYDCYNDGVRYLKEKYGVKRSFSTTSSFGEKLRKAKNKKERQEILASATDNDYITTPNPATDHDGKVIELLLDQYYHGRSVRYELHNKLVSLGYIE